MLTGDPSISGRASMPGSLDRIGNVAVSLTSPITSDLPPPCDPCNSDHTYSEAFSWTPSLARNGPYQLHVAASGSQFLFGVLDGEVASEKTASFQMEVKPAEPTGVRTAANPDQSVRVTWDRNSEPDMIAYRVQRKDPGASAFHDVGGAVAQPAGGSAVSTVDPGTGPGGGTFVYQVQAIRAGRSGDASTAIGSGFSSAQVVVAPSPVAPPPGGAPVPGAPSAAAPESPAPLPNLSAFLSGGGSLPKAALPSMPALPDGTFEETLPFGARPADGLGQNGAEAIGLNAGSSSNGGRAVLIPVAGGLLLCLAAFHVRRFNGWLNATPAGVTTATLATTPAAPPLRPAPAPAVREYAPVPAESWLMSPATDSDPTGHDLADEPEDDTKWAPVTPFGAPAAGFTTTERKPRGNGAAENESNWEDILVKPGAGTTRPSW